MKRACVFLLSGALGLFAASLSHAATIPSTTSVPGSTLIFDTTSSVSIPTPINILVPKFDPALGTLTGVKLDFAFNANIHGVIGAGGGSVSGSLGGAIDIGNQVAATGVGNGGGTGGAPNSVVDVPFTAGVSYTATGSLAQYLAASSGETLPIVFQATSNVSPTGTTGSLQLLGTSNVVTTYTYTLVPEPGMASIVLGLSAIGLRRRRMA